MRVTRASWASICLTFATTSLAKLVVHERAVKLAQQWVKLGNINRNGLLPVRIGLTQQNLEQGHELLMERSDPNSPKYGQHMSQDEVIKLFAPHEDSVNSVTNWLKTEGIKSNRVSQSRNLQWIQFQASVEEIEKLFNATYDIYENSKTGVLHVGTDEYSIPEELSSHVDYITPAITRLRIPSRTNTQQTSRKVRRESHQEAQASPDPTGVIPASPLGGVDITSNCSDFMTPRCLSVLYNIPEGDSSIEGNELGIYELQPYNQTALSWFFEKFSPRIPTNTTPIFSGIDGAPRFSDNETDATTGDVEAMLDLACAYPIVFPQKVRLFNVDDFHYEAHPSHGLFNTFLDSLDGSYCNLTAFNITGDSPEYDPTYPDPDGYSGDEMCGVYKPTNVISISYSPEEQQRSVNYDKRQCSEWMKLSLQGVTIVGATGDYGVAGNGDVCIEDSNGKYTIFNPLALTNCPYVLAVGSTQLVPGRNASEGNEIATEEFFSSGGFSNIYPTPEWQKSAVDKYFDENPSPYKYYNTTDSKDIGAGDGIFNRGGRGFPDVSAIGWDIVLVALDRVTTDGGTSASAPIFAGVLNRINEERLKAGMPTLGFVNPALYANPGILNDITVGNAAGCGTDGFAAAKGWDPVTGLGTPDYPRMLDYFMSLGSK